MINIQLLRSDIDTVAKRLATRGFVLDRMEFQFLEEKRKSIQISTENLQAQRNSLSKLIGQAKAKKDETAATNLLSQATGLTEKVKELEVENEAIQAKQREFVSLIPNLPHESVPVGTSAEQNLEV